MKQYIIFEVDTKVVRWLETRPDETLPIAGDGYAFAEVTHFGGSIDNYWVDKNNKVQFRPLPPSDFHYWENGEWIENVEMRNANMAERIRIERNKLISECDWTDTASAKTRLGKTKFDEWQKYRQELRDITAQTEFPLNVVWPVKPE